MILLADVYGSPGPVILLPMNFVKEERPLSGIDCIFLNIAVVRVSIVIM